MGYFVSQVKLPNSQKLYWFMSAAMPKVGASCVALVKQGTEQELGIVERTYFASDNNDVKKITSRDIEQLAPLLSYWYSTEADGMAWRPLPSIRISKGFLRTPPSTDKIAHYYKKIAHKGEYVPLEINKGSNTLSDGYCAFLVYRMMGIRNVPCYLVTQ